MLKEKSYYTAAFVGGLAIDQVFLLGAQRALVTAAASYGIKKWIAPFCSFFAKKQVAKLKQEITIENDRIQPA